MHEDRHLVSSPPQQEMLPPDDNAASLFLADEAATLALGGAGKTTLVRGLLRTLGDESSGTQQVARLGLTGADRSYRSNATMYL